jgi:AsmA protein
LSAASGLKRLGFVLLAASAAVTGLLIGASYLISAESVRHQALREIRAATGLEPVLRGPATVALFPNGSVSFDDVVLGDSQRPALTAERLTARLRFFPLLMGRVEIADVSLHRPTIAIDIAGNRTTNWSGLIEALAREQNPGVTRTTGFSEMRIEGGVVVVRDLDRKSEEKLTGVDFSLAWPSISRSFGATGRFVWHDEPMDASVTLTDFAAALKGNKTGIKIRVAGRPIKSAFEGSISVSPTLKIEGTVAADAPSLRNALIWAGQRPLPGGGSPGLLGSGVR